MRIQQPEPRGPESALTAAVAILMEPSRKDSGPDRFYERYTRTADTAKQRVVLLAKSYLFDEALDRQAPRVGEVEAKIEHVRELVEELLARLTGLDEVTRATIATWGTGVAAVPDLVVDARYADSDFRGLPRPGSVSPSRWETRLQALSESLSETVAKFKLREGRDRGGNTNALRLTYGAPKRNFVSAGFFVFDMYRPCQATGRDGSTFDLFLKQVFEYATGKKPEEHANILPFLKEVCRSHRRILEVQREIEDVEEQLEGANDNNLPDERKADLIISHANLEVEKMNLWLQVYPQRFSRDEYPRRKTRG